MTTLKLNTSARSAAINGVSVDKPPYHIPTMPEINTIPYNGLKAISLFSGCGGSSLGYRMAGIKVLWANEFIPAAWETYRANFPSTLLDSRDIREIQPEEILKEIRLDARELDILDGSPPCASFSTAGARNKHWGAIKKYSDTEQRTDDLFFEYSRILKGIQPKVFVAENVSGLVKGVAKGYFMEILSELKKSGYRVKCKVLDAKWLGVPQQRERAIFIGVRNDLNLEPTYPTPLKYCYTLRDILNIEVDNGMNVDTDISPYKIGQVYDCLKKGINIQYYNLLKIAKNQSF